MTGSRLGFYITVLVATTFCPPKAAGQESSPDFREVYDLLRSNLSGVSDSELNRAAVSGLISGLSPRAMLVAGGATNDVAASGLVTRTNLFEGNIGYLRIGSVSDGLPEAIRQAFSTLSRTSSVRGLVLDLRYTGGEQYSAAAGVIDMFVKQEKPLLNWGSGSAKSQPKSEALRIPVAALINKQSSGAAEALAGGLRETGTGLLLGSSTAGRAVIYREFPLKNGDRLRIASGYVQLGDGSELSAKGVHPDIVVDVSPTDENAFYADAFRVVRSSSGPLAIATGTNAPRRTRMNEADLVRERREGTRTAEPVQPRTFEPEKPVVHDPALARALDLLKGLALVRRS